MKSLLYALLFSASIIGTSVLAGNAEMMEQRGRQIIELSEDVARQLSQGKIREGRITFEAYVVQPPGGNRVIILDRADIDTVESKQRGIIKQQLIAAVPASSIKLHGSGAALDDVSNTLHQVLNDHPRARIIELNGAALENLLKQLPMGTTDRGAYLIYW